tara:strand:+ start:1423 stop:2517 length:1095 start_codon:yes stop_codon:yes gene_type:complete
MPPPVKRVMFTDPYAPKQKTGDADDLLAVVFAAMTYTTCFIGVIADDASGRRYTAFMKLLGNQLASMYGSSFIREKDLSPELMDGSVIYVHAPLTSRSAELINKCSPLQVFAQGDNLNAVNFKGKAGTETFDILQKKCVKFFSSEETRKTIPIMDMCRSKTGRLLWDMLFQVFSDKKTFGSAAKLGFLVTRLYSDTGFNGKPGSGISGFLPIIGILLREHNKVLSEEDQTDILPLHPTVLGALLKTLHAHEGKFPICPTAQRNLNNLFAVYMHYCHYDMCVLSDGTLPDMASITKIVKKPACRPDVAVLFQYTQSTPVFDFASIALAHGVSPGAIIQKAIETIIEFDNDCCQFEEHQSGAMKSC